MSDFKLTKAPPSSAAARQAAASHRKRPVSFGSDPPIAPGYTRVRGCSGADFGRPLRATVRFLEFAPRC